VTSAKRHQKLFDKITYQISYYVKITYQISYYVLCFGSNRTKTQHIITYLISYLRYVGLRMSSGTGTKNCFIPRILLLLTSNNLTMSINPGAAVPFCSKNLGDLSKNTPTINQLLTAILKAVETVGAHKFTGRKQGVSCCLFFPPLYSSFDF